MLTFSRLVVLSGAVLAAACTTLPSGPSVMVLPGTGKSFDQFRGDDMLCREYAMEQVGGMAPGQAASDSMARSAALGTVVGAAAGAAVGGNKGAGVGAGTGLLAGTMAGSATADTSAYGSQRRYDYAFIQCMYAKGHKVPVSGHFTAAVPAAVPPGPPPPPPPTSSAPPR